MSKRKSHRWAGGRGLWILTAVAVVIALAAVAIGTTLVPHQTSLDNKVFFVIGAGLSVIMLLLIAQVWRYLASGR
jgi:membrane protein YdbS with pleckstrin-like domain